MTRIITDVILRLPQALFTSEDLSPTAAILPSQLELRSFQEESVPLTSCRVWDAMATNLPATPASDDLGLVTGTPGTTAPLINTGDVKALGPTTRKLTFELCVPDNYESGKAFQVRIRAGMLTTIADTTATVDLEVFKPDGAGAVGSDLCATPAATINSLTQSDKDFTITASSLNPGEKLICIVSVAVNDAATVTAVIGQIYSISRRCHTRG